VKLHDRFEEFAQGLDAKFEDGDDEIQPRQARLARGMAGERSAAKLSTRSIAQFLCSSFAPPTPGARWRKNSAVQEMFPETP
jgi:hypothetical protein